MTGNNDTIIFEAPRDLRAKFREAIKGRYSTESEAFRDFMRKLVDESGEAVQ